MVTVKVSSEQLSSLRKELEEKGFEIIELRKMGLFIIISISYFIINFKNPYYNRLILNLAIGLLFLYGGVVW